MPKTLIIEKSDTKQNYYTVRNGDKIASGLTWDEMLGHIAYITCPKGDGWSDDALFTEVVLSPKQALASVAESAA